MKVTSNSNCYVPGLPDRLQLQILLFSLYAAGLTVGYGMSPNVAAMRVRQAATVASQDKSMSAHYISVL